MVQSCLDVEHNLAKRRSACGLATCGFAAHVVGRQKENHMSIYTLPYTIMSMYGGFSRKDKRKRQRYFEHVDGATDAATDAADKAKGAMGYVQDYVNFFIKLVGQEKEIVDLTSKGATESADYVKSAIVLGGSAALVYFAAQRVMGPKPAAV
jgi:hypothetical protein